VHRVTGRARLAHWRWQRQFSDHLINQLIQIVLLEIQRRRALRQTGRRLYIDESISSNPFARHGSSQADTRTAYRRAQLMRNGADHLLNT
jgi:hypothetical protein